MDSYTKMFVNVAILDGIKAEFFHCRNHFTSSFNIYYKFKLTEIIKTIQFSLRNEDFLHFVFECNGCNHNGNM